MVLVTTGMVSVPVGFFGAAVAALALQVLTLKEAYDAIEWPVLILFGALIPVSRSRLRALPSWSPAGSRARLKTCRRSARSA
jgi:hypothetical protein